jgi:formate--tetrahydrofolate ligase
MTVPAARRREADQRETRRLIMTFPSDLDIARAAAPKPLDDIAAEMGLPARHLEPYGRDIMKISLDAIDELADRPTADKQVVGETVP